MPASAAPIRFSAVDVITGTIADLFVDDVAPTSAGVHSSETQCNVRNGNNGFDYCPLDAHKAVVRPDRVLDVSNTNHSRRWTMVAPTAAMAELPIADLPSSACGARAEILPR